MRVFAPCAVSFSAPLKVMFWDLMCNIFSDMPRYAESHDYQNCTIYFRFAAALKDLKLWVMNVVPVNSSDTLPIIYERGLFGIYHDWCESFSTYPRSYDLLHADHLFFDLKKRFDNRC